MGSGTSVDTSNKEIVVIGGGYGGSLLAHKLVKENVGKVTLVEPRDGMFHSIGALRTVVDEGEYTVKKIFYPLLQYSTTSTSKPFLCYT